jgi:hypothetical protein
MIRILITGSRTWENVPLLTASLDEQARGHDQVTLIHGRCDPRSTGGERILWDHALSHPEDGPFLGGDWHAHHHALVRGWAIEAYPANWSLHGSSAGPIRNQRMVDLRPIAVVCVGAPLGKSGGGTRDCMARARKAGIRVVDVTASPEAEGLW